MFFLKKLEDEKKAMQDAHEHVKELVTQMADKYMDNVNKTQEQSAIKLEDIKKLFKETRKDNRKEWLKMAKDVKVEMMKTLEVSSEMQRKIDILNKKLEEKTTNMSLYQRRLN